MSRADAAGRAGLRTRLPGIDAQIGRTVADMADYYQAQEVRVWTDIRPVMRDGLSIGAGWTVTVYARIPGMEEVTMPVIPDEFNDRPGKVIKATDKPYEFRYMSEAEKAAETAAAAMRAEIKSQLGV